MKKPTTVLAIIAIVGSLALGLTASQVQQVHAAVTNMKHCSLGAGLHCESTSQSNNHSFRNGTHNILTHISNP